MSTKPDINIKILVWPASRLGEAIAAIARKSMMDDSITDPRNPSMEIINHTEELGRWIQNTASQIGLEAVMTHSKYQSLAKDLCTSPPALLQISHDSEPRYIIIIKSRKNELTILTPDLEQRKLPVESLRQYLCLSLEEKQNEDINTLISESTVSTKNTAAVRQALLNQMLDNKHIPGLWLLRQPAESNLWHQFKQSKLHYRLITLGVAHAISYIMWILSWIVLGNAALQGRIDDGWLIAWVLLLITMVPFKLWVTWSQGILSINAGAILKKRLLASSMKLSPDETKTQGVGKLFGRVIETEELESLTINGGILSAVSLIEILVAIVVLGLGAGGTTHVLLMFCILFATLYLVNSAYKRTVKWTQARLDITHDMVEGMCGYRTRLAQQDPQEMHISEDAAVNSYLYQSQLMDRSLIRISLIPRAWLVVGLLGIVPPFVFATHGVAGLAISLGGILLSYRALLTLTSGVEALIRARVAWQQLMPVLNIKNKSLIENASDVLLKKKNDTNNENIFNVKGISYRYRSKSKEILQGCNLEINHGDKILLEGVSGGGKSTLVSLMTGMLKPESGLLLLHGFDEQTVGNETWRNRVVSVPQFHDNHIFMGPFAFNVLMGRQWPPSYEDVVEAEKVCRELGLGELIDTMPGNMMQIVGDTGWQLSHGEKSRVFMARALLQNADLIIFDESFAALDPENLEKCLHYVMERSPTMMVVAHP